MKFIKLAQWSHYKPAEVLVNPEMIITMYSQLKKNRDGKEVAVTFVDLVADGTGEENGVVVCESPSEIMTKICNADHLV